MTKELSMISLRLEQSLEKELVLISKLKHQTKTDTIKKALQLYFDSVKSTTRKPTAYALGADSFGKYGSGQDDLSTTYKEKLKEKIDAKNHH